MTFVGKNSIKQSILPQVIASATTVNGVEVDARGWERAVIVAATGDLTGASPNAVVKLQHSAVSGSGYTDITGAALTAFTASVDQKIVCGTVHVDVSKPYLRAVVTTTGTITAIPIAVSLVLEGARGQAQPALTNDVDVTA